MTRVRWSAVKFNGDVISKGSRVSSGDCSASARFVDVSISSTGAGGGGGGGGGAVVEVVKLHVGPVTDWLAIVLLTIRQKYVVPGCSAVCSLYVSVWPSSIEPVVNSGCPGCAPL